MILYCCLCLIIRLSKALQIDRGAYLFSWMGLDAQVKNPDYLSSYWILKMDETLASSLKRVLITQYSDNFCC